MEPPLLKIKCPTKEKTGKEKSSGEARRVSQAPSLLLCLFVFWRLFMQ